MEELTDQEIAEITGLRAGTVRVRLHRSRLFVRKELMKLAQPRQAVHGVKTTEQARPARCKAMFAELSDYLDEQLDDSLCEELEKHLDGCEPCKVFLSTLQATIEQCRKSPSECPDPKKAAKLRQQLLATYERALKART